MLKKLLAVLCVLALLPVTVPHAHATIDYCKCTEADATWAYDAGSMHQLVCEHGNVFASHSIDMTHQVYIDEEYHGECNVPGCPLQNPREHSGTCTDPYTCVDCGVTNESGFEFYHITTPSTRYDSTHHWYACDDCDSVAVKSVHTVNCDAPTACLYCDAVVESVDPDNVVHVGETSFRDNGDGTHTIVCGACNEPAGETLYHQAVCTDKFTCSDCGATSTNGDSFGFSHTGTPSMRHDDTQHWYACGDCENTAERYRHMRLCTSPEGVCDECGTACGDDALLIEHRCAPVYTYDAEYHYPHCPNTGEESNIPEPHMAVCTDPYTCRDCGYTSSTPLENIFHIAGGATYHYDSTSHWYSCSACESIAVKYRHQADCTSSPYYCLTCPATGDTYTYEMNHVGEEVYLPDGDLCVLSCTACQMALSGAESHEAACTDKYTCRKCGTSFTEKLSFSHTGANACERFDEDFHWFACDDCDAIAERSAHSAVCSRPFNCENCSYESEWQLDFYHLYADVTLRHDDVEHWYACDACDRMAVRETHYNMCNAPDTCAVCGIPYTSPADEYVHSTKDSPLYADEKNHWYECDLCNQPAYVTPHDFSTGACSCGWTPDDSSDNTGSDTPESAPHEHGSATTRVEPTCTEDGHVTVYCPECKTVESKTVLPATGHTCTVYTANEDGTHTAVCDACGEEIVSDCELTVTETGDAIISVCDTCGYRKVEIKVPTVVVIPAETIVAMKPVEQVTVAPVTENAITSDMQLIVHEAELTAPVIPENVEGTVSKLFVVTLLQENEAVQPAGKISLRLPLTEEEITACETKALTLVLILTDGTMIEIPYTIVDGEMVFETEFTGTFMLVDKTATMSDL